MHPHVSLLSAVMTGATILAVAAAIADEIPKEGTHSGTSSNVGRVTQSFVVGKDMDQAVVAFWDESGTISGGSKQRCFGLSQTVQGMEQATGYCIITDPDGDQILMRSTTEPRFANTPTLHGADQALMGTGKFKGVTAADTFSCRQGGDPSQYTSDCDWKGSYKLP